MTSPFFKCRLTTAPLLSSKKVPETPLNTCSSSSSCTSTDVPSSSRCWPTTFLFVSAPVGQDTMHSPQETQDELPIGRSVSNEIDAAYPLPCRAMTKLWRISEHPRMQRSHKMQAE